MYQEFTLGCIKDWLSRRGTTMAKQLWRTTLGATLLIGSLQLGTESLAQAQDDVQAAEEADETSPTTIDRGRIRLNLLMKLVTNELEEAKLAQARLSAEAVSLDQERRELVAGPQTGSKAETRRLAVIDERLQKIDQELVDVNQRLSDVESERAELQSRLDEANGVVRQADAEPSADGVVLDEASQWLDSKRQVQEALVYLGGYNALIDGDFGPRTREAIKIYQSTKEITETGLLSPQQEARLLDEANTIRTRYGVKLIENREEGYRIAYPSGLLTSFEEISPGGKRYSTNDGQGELLITASSDGNGGTSLTADFTAIYDDLLGRYEVQYRRKRDDWFVVAGIAEDSRIIYDTARVDGDRIIRAQLTYPSDWRGLWSPFAVIMFNSFETFTPGES